MITTIIHPCVSAKQRQRAHRIERVVRDLTLQTENVAVLHERLQAELPRLSPPYDVSIPPLTLSMDPVDEVSSEVTVWTGGRMLMTITNARPIKG